MSVGTDESRFNKIDVRGIPSFALYGLVTLSLRSSRERKDIFINETSSLTLIIEDPVELEFL